MQSCRKSSTTGWIPADFPLKYMNLYERLEQKFNDLSERGFEIMHFHWKRNWQLLLCWLPFQQMKRTCSLELCCWKYLKSGKEPISWVFGKASFDSNLSRVSPRNFWISAKKLVILFVCHTIFFSNFHKIHNLLSSTPFPRWKASFAVKNPLLFEKNQEILLPNGLFISFLQISTRINNNSQQQRWSSTTFISKNKISRDYFCSRELHGIQAKAERQTFLVLHIISITTLEIKAKLVLMSIFASLLCLVITRVHGGTG